MPSQKTWFLPPDFTFLENGLLRLGTVIPSPRNPSLILLDPDTYATTTPPIDLPTIQTSVQKSQSHSNDKSRSFGGELWSNFLALASASVNADFERINGVEYGTVDHEVVSFSRPITNEALATIIAQPSVQDHMTSGLFGRSQPVYIISGLRITMAPMSVSTSKGSTRSAGISGSAPIPSGVPVELGAGIHGGLEEDQKHSYETAARIIFAYRVNVIREKRQAGPESQIFSHRTAFMTGGDEEIEMEEANFDPLEMEDLLENEDFRFSEHAMEDGDLCVSFS